MAGEAVVSTIKSWIGGLTSVAHVLTRTSSNTTGPICGQRSICADGCNR